MQQLAAVLQASGDQESAQRHWSESAELYRKTLAKSDGPGQQKEQCFEQLRIVYQNLNQLPQAMDAAEQLLEYRTRKFSAGNPSTYEAKTTLGTLCGYVGLYEKARPPLEEVQDYWRSRKPPQPLELVKALNNLAAFKRAIGSLNEAQALFEEVVSIRSKLLPADSPDLAAAHNNFASVLVAKGRYAQGTALYRRKIEVCQQHGKSMDGLQSTTLLNLAVAYRSQGLETHSEPLLARSRPCKTGLPRRTHPFLPADLSKST